jgi:hypothetical protein
MPCRRYRRMMRFEHGSAYDDDAANEGRPAHEVDAERRRDMALTHGPRRPVAEVARLVRYRAGLRKRWDGRCVHH